MSVKSNMGSDRLGVQNKTTPAVFAHCDSGALPTIEESTSMHLTPVDHREKPAQHDDEDYVEYLNRCAHQYGQHPPAAPPGFELLACQAEPRHWPTYAIYDSDFYGGGRCPTCEYIEQRERIDQLEHLSHHTRWRSWRVVRWLSHRFYSWGVIAGSSLSMKPCCAQTRMSWRGKRTYLFGKRRAWWTHLLTTQSHLPGPFYGDWCGTCLPCPDCGATNWHHSCGGVA